MLISRGSFQAGQARKLRSLDIMRQCLTAPEAEWKEEAGIHNGSAVMMQGIQIAGHAPLGDECGPEQRLLRTEDVLEVHGGVCG
jgi:hypothetical protein